MDKKLSGQVMFGVGFILILVNALSYIFNLDISPVLGILGILFVAIGMMTVRKYSKLVPNKSS